MKMIAIAAALSLALGAGLVMADNTPAVAVSVFPGDAGDGPLGQASASFPQCRLGMPGDAGDGPLGQASAAC